MGKIIKKLKADDIGDMGIGAMIVFIAMVLVAGIAASVLVQTANRLEIQAMKTGQETIGEVSTGLAVTAIASHSNGTVLDMMSITIQPRAGSYSIDLGETFVELSDSSMKIVLTYDSNSFNDTPAINGDLFNVSYARLNASLFGVIVLQDADSSLSAAHPVINTGDKVMLTVNLTAIFTTAPAGLGTRIPVWGTIQPEEGAPGVFAFTTPPSFAATTVIALY
jgi:flagellin FlaB